MKNIIILHGWGSSAEKWQEVKRQIEQISGGPSSVNLAKARPLPIEVIIPDLPGFRKETTLSRTWNLDDYINWFKNLFFEQGDCLAKPSNSLSVLIGHSFGGRMAIKFAAQNPEKLKALILVSSAGIKHTKGNFEKNFGKYDLPKFVNFGRSYFPKCYSVFRRFFYRYILRKTDYINAEKMPYLQETFKNIIAEDLTPYLEKIKTPTLIIWGDKDKMTPVSDAYLMNKKIPNSKLEILENIGHAPHLECPKVLAEKIHKFINMSF